MTEKQLKLLYDIKLSIDDIESYFEKESRAYENYKNNHCLNALLKETLRSLEKQ